MACPSADDGLGGVGTDMKYMTTAAMALVLVAGLAPDLAAAQRWRQDDGPPPRQGNSQAFQGQQNQENDQGAERRFGGGRPRGEGAPPVVQEQPAPQVPQAPPAPPASEGRWTAHIGNATSGPGAQDFNRRGDETARQGRGDGGWRGRDRGPGGPPQDGPPPGGPPPGGPPQAGPPPGSPPIPGDFTRGGDQGRFQGAPPPQGDVRPGGNPGRYQGGPPPQDDARRRNDNDDRRGGRWDNDNRPRWDGDRDPWNDRRGNARDPWNGRPGYDRDPWNARPGYDRHDHRMRDRDRGRDWFDQRRWRPEYRSNQRYRIAPYRYPRGWFPRIWVFGDFLPWGWYSDSYYLDWRYYGLPVPPIGCEWIRVGQDALLVDVWSGEVLSVYRYLFW